MSDLADWSAIPADIYVIAARSHDGIVHEVDCCSVPMATSPEVRYCRADYVDQRIAAAVEAERKACMGETQKWLCRHCGKWFVPPEDCCSNPSWERQREPEEIYHAIAARGKEKK